MLELMSPWEYTSDVRPVLGHGSGFDSPGWNRVRHAAPALGQAFHELRRGEGLSLADVYAQGRDREDLYQLAEALTDLDEWATTWRVRHFMVVERIIGGDVVGTQGTPVEMLGKLVERKLYPELWKVRTELTNKAIEGSGLSDAADAWSGATYERIAEAFVADPPADGRGARARAGRAVSRPRLRYRRRRADRRPRGAEVSGLDISADQLAKARAAAEAEGLPIRFDEGDAQALPYADGELRCRRVRLRDDLRARPRPRGGRADAGLPAGRPVRDHVLASTDALVPAQRAVAARLRGAGLEQLERRGVRPRPALRSSSSRFERGEATIAAGSDEECWQLLSSSVPPLKAWLDTLDAAGARALLAREYQRAARGTARSPASTSLALGDAPMSLRDEAVELLQALIRLDTVNPPGNETAAAELLRAYLEPFGVECELYARVPERANLVARIPGRGDGPSLLLLSHTDTVLADPAEWSVDPWSGELRDGCVWGRGALDMKGQVAASAVAIASLAREGFEPGRRPDLRRDRRRGDGRGRHVRARVAVRGAPGGGALRLRGQRGRRRPRRARRARALPLLRRPRSGARRSSSTSRAGAATARCRRSPTTRSSRRPG